MHSNSPLQAHVISHRNDPNESAIYYTIQILDKSGDNWRIDRRFSQFEDLLKKLKVFFGEQLPSLPKKKYITFLIGKSQEDIEKRKIGLDQFIQELVNRPEIVASNPFKDFFEIDKNAKEIIVNPPQLIFQFKEFQLGIRDFILNSECGLMFVLTSDCSVINRIDAYLTNRKGPWESEKDEVTQIAVGSVECWHQTQNGEFQKLWAKLYNSQAITCYWDNIASVLLVGLDSGSINYLIVLEKEGFQRYQESQEIEQHKGRIMGLYYDRRNKYIHSISKDHKYKVFNLRMKELVADFIPDQYELTSLLASDERRKVFIGDRHGQIFIYDIEKQMPSYMIKITTNQLFLRGLFIDHSRNYLFSVSHENGIIIIIDIQNPGQEQFAKQITNLNGKIKSREISWSSKRGEIYVGNVDGTVTIWDARNSNQLFVLKAHDSDITKLQWLDSEKTLVTASKDKRIKVWQLPQFWRDPKIMEKENQIENQLTFKKLRESLFFNSKIQIDMEIGENEDNDMIIWDQPQKKQSGNSFEDLTELK
ncbi:unnamed protein product [Paramecium primaurelia]|uniref:PX domain-containing protein n=1 Tax=Paramecium primaurelia TaxID=5886 RepID=A0A8S1MQ22_PARPR|nr:unnamed protein product [Paramecium primaurelia]